MCPQATTSRWWIRPMLIIISGLSISCRNNSPQAQPSKFHIQRTKVSSTNKTCNRCMPQQISSKEEWFKILTDSKLRSKLKIRLATIHSHLLAIPRIQIQTRRMSIKIYKTLMASSSKSALNRAKRTNFKNLTIDSQTLVMSSLLTHKGSRTKHWNRANWIKNLLYRPRGKTPWGWR